MSKVLVVGAGGREHAIAYKFHQEGHQVFLLGDNPAVAEFGTCLSLTEPELITFCQTEPIDLVFIGPEVYLVDGLVDRLQAAGIRAFGPSAQAAQLEGSKVFSKQMMAKYQIPTAKHESFSDYEAAKQYLAQQATPIVLKADGLAAGKGVIIAQTQEEAQAALKAMMQEAKFADAGGSVVIEEFLEGEEFSLMCFVSDRKVVPMKVAQDHKRALDGDRGLNTGGMGAYLPISHISDRDVAQGLEQVVQPMVDAMSQEGMPFYGILYAGLMKCADGVKTIEFNVRFGDPECEVLLLQLKSSLYQVANAVIDGQDFHLEWDQDAVIGVVLAAKGYPEASVKGSVIKGLDQLSVPVFHMGTRKLENELTINGGRVLIVCAKGTTLASARQKVYDEIKKIDCPDLFYRQDIGYRSL